MQVRIKGGILEVDSLEPGVPPVDPPVVGPIPPGVRPPIPPAPPGKPPVAMGHLQVAKASGSPGDTVDVEVRGGSNMNLVNGIAVNCGLGHVLHTTGCELGPMLSGYLGNAKYELFKEYPTGAPEPFWTYFLGFYSIEGGEKKDPIVIPEDTLLFTVKYKIPPDANKSTRTLYCADSWFYHTVGMRLATIFGSLEISGGLPLVIDSYHGEVDIV